MNMHLWRGTATAKSIPGELMDEQGHLAFTLERPAVAIPAGGPYPVTIYFSPHLGREVPLLNDVPGRSLRDTRSYIEMHWGSFPQNSDGCILVGETRLPDEIIGTREEFDLLFPVIKAAVQASGCWITVHDPQNNSESVQDATAGE